MSVHQRLAAVVRRREGLVALRLERTAELPWSTSVLDAVKLLAESLPIAAVEVGLHELPPEERGDAEGLLVAWERLASARVTSESLADLLHVLLSTSLDEPVASGIASFRGAAPLPRFRPTAAHPRAYEGTGARPPKLRAPRRIALQAVSVDPRAAGILMEEFAGMLPAAIELLPSHLAHHARRVLSTTSRGTASGVWEGAGLPREFRILVRPLLRGVLEEEEIGRLYTAFRRHPCHGEPSLYTAAAWSLAHATAAAALPWLHAALQLPDRLAEVALLVWADSGAHDCGPEDVPLMEIAAGSDDVSRFALDLRSLFLARGRRIDPHLMLPGLELSRSAGLEHHAGGAAPRELVASKPVSEFAAAHLEYKWERRAVELWWVLSSVPGFGELFLRQPWSGIEPEAIEALVEVILWLKDDDDLPSSQAAWWAAHIDATVEAVSSAPAEFQAKLADTIATTVVMWGDLDKRRALWQDLLEMASRLSRPPFRSETRAVEIWNNILERRDPALRRQIIQAPDRLWIRLEKRSRVPAASRLLGRGLDALSYHHGDLLAHAFLDGTPLLYDVGRLLGGMSGASADAICRAVRGSVNDPVSWLRELLHRALDDLGRGLALDTQRRDVQHALLLQRSLEQNRRALRRFLRAHMDGDVLYVLRHPLTQRWLQAHPEVRLEGWQDGIVLDAQVEGVGALTLRVERDPLEVLQLGTYVGSCLSVGGICDYSAAAAALDVNKQVVYARSRRGGVIARQLVAISEAGELVAFEVYPRSSPVGVKRLFAEYDRRFAQELGLRLCATPKEGAYVIAEVLSENWWDDGAWKVSRSEAGPTRRSA